MLATLLHNRHHTSQLQCVLPRLESASLAFTFDLFLVVTRDRFEGLSFACYAQTASDRGSD